MEGIRFLRSSQIILLGLCIAAATILSTVILSKTLIKIKRFTSEVISATGSAEKKIMSDYCVWRCSFARIAPDLKSAYSSLERDLGAVKSYFSANDIGRGEMVAAQVAMETLYKKNSQGYSTNEIESYRLTQNVEISSEDVQKVAELSRKSTELINEGIGFTSEAPQYFYTKLSELKLEMIGHATENAKQRAETMASATGNRIGLMRSAKLGVFQITPVNSTEVSSWGMNDTSSLEKKVTAVVHAEFGLREA